MIKWIHKLTRQLWVALLWTLFVAFLLCLPANNFPQQPVFKIKHLDKFIHLVLFGNLVLFWGSSVYHRLSEKQQFFKYLVITLLFSIFYGIFLEYVQVTYIPSRTFEWDDIWADSAGSGLAALFLGLWGKRLGLLG